MRVKLPGQLRLGPVLASTAIMAVIAIIAVLLTTLVPARSRSRPRASEPPMAKSFSLSALGAQRTTISLARYAGRPVIINFFASWCKPCKQETPLIAAFYRSHHGRVLVIGIDANDQESAALAFVRAQGVRYPVAFDPSASVTSSYGVAALPQTFFLNARHQIVKRVAGALTKAELNSWAASLGH